MDAPWSQEDPAPPVLHAAISACVAGSVQLEVRLMPASHSFEVSGNGNLSVSGK